MGARAHPSSPDFTTQPPARLAYGSTLLDGSPPHQQRELTPTHIARHAPCVMLCHPPRRPAMQQPPSLIGTPPTALRLRLACRTTQPSRHDYTTARLSSLPASLPLEESSSASLSHSSCPHPSHTQSQAVPARVRGRTRHATRDMRHATGLFRCPRRFVLRPSPPAPAAPRASSSLRSLAALSLPCSRLLSSRLWRLPHSP